MSTNAQNSDQERIQGSIIAATTQTSIICMSRLRWYGHVMQMQPNDMPRQAIEEMIDIVERGRLGLEKDLKKHGNGVN